jgi:hypothetical protein
MHAASGEWRGRARRCCVRPVIDGKVLVVPQIAGLSLDETGDRRGGDLLLVQRVVGLTLLLRGTPVLQQRDGCVVMGGDVERRPQ